jgi:hypothetical protein
MTAKEILEKIDVFYYTEAESSIIEKAMQEYAKQKCQEFKNNLIDELLKLETEKIGLIKTSDVSKLILTKLPKFE